MDLRNHTRFFAPKDIYVLVEEQSITAPGFLINISQGGVGIEYIPLIGALTPNRSVNLIFTGGNVGIEQVPGKTIFDIEIEEEYHTAVQFRKLGIKFQQLTNKQKIELRLFLRQLSEDA